MTDDGGTFLGRWARRKAQARGADEAPPPAGLQPAPPTTGDPEPDEIALEDLPPIDSIDASTDLTPWLRKNVPEAWKRAALSRAWAADPAISQFTGLADYAWDWNAPDGVPGFGPLRTTDNVAELLAQAIGEVPRPPAPREVVSAQPETALAPEPAQDERLEEQVTLPNKAADEPLPGDAALPPLPSEPSMSLNAAPEPQALRRRRGGGALPT
jgi:hypothetical protein